MWHRGWGGTSCVVLVAFAFAFACGKAERDNGEGYDGRAGSMLGGAGSMLGGAPSTSAGSADGGTSGSSVSSAGAPVTVGGSNAMGGAGSALGGEPNEPDQAGAPSTAGAPSCSGHYLACGCGCCGTTASPGACVYPDLGQDLTTVTAEDVAKKTGDCAAVGCGIGRDYFCCAAPPPTNDGASYQASVLIGGVDRLTLYKVAKDCSNFVLQQTFPANPVDPNPFPVEVPAGWKIESVTTLPCISSAFGPKAIGAIGKFSLRVLNEACVVDAHLSAFFTNDQRALNAVRFDADGVPIALPVSQCK
jgi:hypothetical protein